MDIGVGMSDDDWLALYLDNGDIVIDKAGNFERYQCIQYDITANLVKVDEPRVTHWQFLHANPNEG